MVLAMLRPVPAYLAATGILVVLTILVHFLVKGLGATTTTVRSAGGQAVKTKVPDTSRKRGLLGMVIGEDFRASTSKVQLTLWTYAVAFVFLALIFEGLRDVVFGTQLTEKYVFLLGIPAIGAAGAKLITTAKVEDGAISKTPADANPEDSAPQGLARSVAELVSDDEGRGDVGDFQYLVFNVVALVYFFADLFDGSPDHLPDLPATLVALTGASAFAYLAKKGVVKDRPAITAVYPSTAAVSNDFSVLGVGLLDNAGTADGAEIVPKPEFPVILVGGYTATIDQVAVRGLHGQRVEAKVPNGPSGTVDVVAITEGGLRTDPVTMTVA